MAESPINRPDRKATKLAGLSIIGLVLMALGLLAGVGISANISDDKIAFLEQQLAEAKAQRREIELDFLKANRAKCIYRQTARWRLAQSQTLASKHSAVLRNAWKRKGGSWLVGWLPGAGDAMDAYFTIIDIKHSNQLASELDDLDKRLKRPPDSIYQTCRARSR